MHEGIPYEGALHRYQAWHRQQPDSSRELRGETPERNELLRLYHPDYQEDSRGTLLVGENRGSFCHGQLLCLLHSNALIDEVDLAGTPIIDTDVLVVGGGGAGCAAALTAAQEGARVMLATKLRLGDSNTVMAEGGIQAAVGADDSPQLHYDDTLRAGHYAADRKLVAQMVMDGPDVIRWLIQLGMVLDFEGGIDPLSDLVLKRPGGASAPRILSYGDYTGLEMMRVLREAVTFETAIKVFPAHPVLELLSNEFGECAGAVILDLNVHKLLLVRASAVILTTGGIGRLHLNGFPTSNHFGATGDGLVLAYRMGAKLCDLDSFQYHPTGLAHPTHLKGSLVSEAVRSSGAHLVNGLGERFVDELLPRDVVAAAVIRECAEGRGIVRDGQVGVWLDTPGLEREQPGTLARFGAMQHLAAKCGHDPAETPFLIYPTLHYQNGGVMIDAGGASAVPGLYCAGEVTGGIHGRNRLMGNSLLDIFSFGRRAGSTAAAQRHRHPLRKIGIEHVHNWRRALTLAGLPLDSKAPLLFPDYANFVLGKYLRSSALG